MVTRNYKVYNVQRMFYMIQQYQKQSTNLKLQNGIIYYTTTSL